MSYLAEVYFLGWFFLSFFPDALLFCYNVFPSFTAVHSVRGYGPGHQLGAR